jgi:hypothetical protein
MKKIIPFVLIALFAFTSKGFSQFDQPSFQLGVGLAMPLEQLKGDNFLSTTTYQGFQVTQIDTVNFLRNNYGAKTGFSLHGKAKINFDKYNIVRGVGSIGFTASMLSSRHNQEIMFSTITIRYSYSLQVIIII